MDNGWLDTQLSLNYRQQFFDGNPNSAAGVKNADRIRAQSFIEKIRDISNVDEISNRASVTPKCNRLFL